MSLSLWSPIKVNYQQKRSRICKDRKAHKMCSLCVCSMATIFIEIKAILWQEVVPRFLSLWHIYIIRTLYAIEGRILLLNMVLSLFLLCNAVLYARIYLYISMQVAYLHDILTAIYSHNGYSKFKRISITHSRVMVMPNLIFGLRTAHAEQKPPLSICLMLI